MDLSSIPTDQLQAIAKGQSKSQDLSSIPTDQLQAIASRGKPQESNSLLQDFGENNPNKTPIADRLNAIGGGMRQGLVSDASDLGGLATNGMPQNAQQALRQVGTSIGNRLIASPNSITGQAEQQYPGYAEGGKIVGQVLPYAALGAMTGGAGNIALGALQGAANSPDGVGNRIEGGLTGALTVVGMNKLGSLLQAGISSLRSPGIVSQLSNWTKEQAESIAKTFGGTPAEVGAKGAANVYNLTRAADTKAFDAFRSLPMNFNKDMYQVKRTAEDLLNAHEDILDSTQKQVFQKVANLANTDSTIAQMHDIRKTLAASYDTFTPQKGAITNEAYKQLRDQVEQKLPEMAKKGGVLDEFNNANQHYQTKMLPLVNAKLGDLSDALSQQGQKTDPVGAGKMLDHWIDNNIKVDSPNTTKALLGAMDSTTRNSIEVRSLQKITNDLDTNSNPVKTLTTRINKLGATADALYTDDNKDLVSGAKRVLNEGASTSNLMHLTSGYATNIPFKAVGAIISDMASSVPGQMALRVLGDPGISKSTIASFLRQGAVLGTTSALNTTKQSSGEGQ